MSGESGCRCSGHGLLNQCKARSRLLRRCDRPDGHSGQHSAYTDDGRLIDRWDGAWTIRRRRKGREAMSEPSRTSGRVLISNTRGDGSIEELRCTRDSCALTKVSVGPDGIRYNCAATRCSGRLIVEKRP